MHFSAPRLCHRVAVARALREESLEGSLIDGPRFLRELTRRARPAAGLAPSQRCHVHNAVLEFRDGVPALELHTRALFDHCTLVSDRKVPLFRRFRFREVVTFDNCTFAPHRGAAAFDDCAFDKLALFEHCAFLDDTTFAECLFDRPKSLLQFVAVEARGRLVADCRFFRPPTFREVRAAGEVVVRLTPSDDGGAWQDSEAEPTCQFDACDLAGGFELVVPRRTQVVFFETRFAAGTLGTLDWETPAGGAGGIERVSFESCHVAGAVAIRETRTGPGDGGLGVAVSLCRATVTGALDLSKVVLRTIDLDSATLTDGRLIFHEGHFPKPLAWTSLRLVPGNRSGPLLAETAEPIGRDRAVRSAHFFNLAHQYGELRNAMSRVPTAAKQEDYCHYKHKLYTRRGATALVGGANLVATWFRWPAALGLLAVGVLGFGAGLRGAIAAAAAGCAVALVVFAYRARVDSFRLTWVFWDWLFLQVAIGYGVYLRCVLLTSAFMIAAFAGVYWLFTACDPELGCVALSDGETILTEGVAGVDSPPSGETEIARKFLYFSTVTFTTLGYGDYKPMGWLQAVAMAQTMLGAITIALLTVVLSRKFLR